MLNRRKFIAGLAAAVLAVPVLPEPVKQWAGRQLGFVKFNVTVTEDGDVSVKQKGPIKWVPQ